MKLLLFPRSIPRQEWSFCGHPPRGWFRCVVFLLLFTMVGIPSTYSQELPKLKIDAKAQALNAKIRRPPESHLYMHFLLHQNRLDKLAAERDAKGMDGSIWRNHLQQKVGFTDAEMAVVRATGLRLESELKEIGTNAVAIARANRVARAQNPQNAPPMPDPRLQQLTKEREDTIEREMGNLNRDLGPVTAAKLSDFIQNRYLESSAFRAMIRPHYSRSYEEQLQQRRQQGQDQKAVQP